MKPFFLIGSLPASLLFSRFGFEAQALGFRKLSPARGLRLFLLLAFFIYFQAEGLFLFFLLFDDCQVVFLFVFIRNAWLLAICVFVIFGIDRSVVLVGSTTALSFTLASHKLIFFREGACEQITLLSVELEHEVLLTLVALHAT